MTLGWEPVVSKNSPMGPKAGCPTGSGGKMEKLQSSGSYPRPGISGWFLILNFLITGCLERLLWFKKFESHDLSTYSSSHRWWHRDPERLSDLSKHAQLEKQSQGLIIGWICVEGSGWEEKTVVLSLGIKMKSRKVGERINLMGNIGTEFEVKWSGGYSVWTLGNIWGGN